MGRGILSLAILTLAMALSPDVAAKTVANTRASRDQRAFAQALDAFDRQDYLGSRKLLVDLVKRHPEKGLYWFNLGNAEIKLKDWHEAILAYERVVKQKSPLAGVAGIYLSKAARGQGNLETALKWMRWVGKQSFPPNVEEVARDEAALVQAAFMSQGMVEYDSAAYSKAVPLFEKVNTIEGDPQLAAQSDMMKGLSLLREDRTDRAQSEFEALMNRESIAGVQEYARYFSRLNQQATTLDPPYWLSFDVAMSYNSNLFGDGNPATAEGCFVVPWFVGGGVRAFRSGLYSVIVGDSLSGEEPIGMPSSRFFKESLWGVLKYQTPAWLVQIATQTDYTLLGVTPYALRPSLSVSAQRVIGLERLGLTLSAAHQFAESDTFSYVQGNAWYLRAFWIHRGNGWTGGPFVFFNRENSAPLPLTAGTLPLGYTGFGPGFSGYLTPIRGWELSGSATYAWRSYYDPSEPGDVARSDSALNVFAKVARRVSHDFAPYISLDATVNSSTLGLSAPEDKNYTQLIVATGVSWDLL